MRLIRRGHSRGPTTSTGHTPYGTQVVEPRSWADRVGDVRTTSYSGALPNPYQYSTVCVVLTTFGPPTVRGSRTVGGVKKLGSGRAP